MLCFQCNKNFKKRSGAKGASVLFVHLRCNEFYQKKNFLPLDGDFGGRQSSRDGSSVLKGTVCDARIEKLSV